MFYSYFTESDLIVMRETTIVARVSAPFVPLYRGAVWTADGGHVATLTDENPGDEESDPAKRELIAVEAATGAVRRWPCPGCTSVAAIDGSEVLVSVSYDPVRARTLDQVLRIDLAGREATVRLPPIALPGEERLMQAVILAGAGGQALVRGVDRQGRQVSYFYRRDGGSALSASVAGAKGATHAVVDAGALVGAEGQVRVAVAGSVKENEYSCAARGSIEIHRPAGGKAVDTQLVTVARSSPLLISHDLWWEPNGELHAIVYAGQCTGDPEITMVPTEWRWADGNWRQISTEPRWQVRPLDSSTRLLLLPEPTFADQSELVLESAGRRVLIDPDAVTIAAPRPRPVECQGCGSVIDPDYREPKRKPGPGVNAFLGTWGVHGWEVQVLADRTATSRRYQISCVRPFNGDCFADLRYQVSIDRDGRTMRLTLRAVRYAVADGGSGRTVARPVFEYPDSEFTLGSVSTYRWVRDGLIKDITLPPGVGNPYLCSRLRPPIDSRECGA